MSSATPATVTYAFNSSGDSKYVWLTDAIRRDIRKVEGGISVEQVPALAARYGQTVEEWYYQVAVKQWPSD